jgi:hypothetical protein
VSRLPPDFPLSDSFDTPVRRVTFQLEDGQLRMSQKQLLDEDEAKYFVPLAHNVKDMRFLFFDRAQNKWVDEWKRRNLLPERIKISLRVGQGSAYSTHAGEEIVHIVGWPLTMVPISPLTPRTPPP